MRPFCKHTEVEKVAANTVRCKKCGKEFWLL